jgi:hypothetical protein
MGPQIGDGTLETAIEACRAPRTACDRYLEWLSHQDEHERRSTFETFRCVALLSVIADRLELDRRCPIGLIDATIELARELPQDAFACAAACRAAADALTEWLNGGYEHH